MNDLDLRTALHRDADLVGSPSPDLLDQLVQRRQHQRRQRAGMLSAVAGAWSSSPPASRSGSRCSPASDGSPASETTVAPTPSVTPEVATTRRSPPTCSRRRPPRRLPPRPAASRHLPMSRRLPSSPHGSGSPFTTCPSSFQLPTSRRGPSFPKALTGRTTSGTTGSRTQLHR